MSGIQFFQVVCLRTYLNIGRTDFIYKFFASAERFRQRKIGAYSYQEMPLVQCGVWELNPPGYRSRQTLR